MIRPIFLSFLLTLLLALPAAGQVLGLGELIWLRRVSEKKAARMLKAKGWELKVTAPKGADGFATQTWVPNHNGTTDSTRLTLQFRRSWWRSNYLTYTVGHDAPGHPGRLAARKRFRNGQQVASSPAIFYPSIMPSPPGQNIRVRHLDGAGSGIAKFRDYGCSVWSKYAGAFPWVSVGVITTSHRTIYDVRAYHNPVMPLLLTVLPQ